MYILFAVDTDELTRGPKLKETEGVDNMSSNERNYLISWKLVCILEQYVFREIS